MTDPHEAWNKPIEYRGLLFILVGIMAFVFVLNMLSGFQ